MTKIIDRRNFEIILNALNYWDNLLDVNRETLLAYLKGSELLLPYASKNVTIEDETYIIGMICNYIWNNYRIKHYNFERTINNLAIFKNQDWVETFIQVLKEFQKQINWEKGFALLNRNSIFTNLNIEELKVLDWESEINIGENDLKLSIGDNIQLGDKMKDDYKNTLYYDFNLECPKWDLFIPSDKSFKNVYFSHGNHTLGNVTGAYSLMKSKVLKLFRYNDKDYALTHHFLIDIENAIGNSELILEENLRTNGNQNWQDINMEEFHDRADAKIQGLYTDSEFWRNIVGFDSRVIYDDKIKRSFRGLGYSTIHDLWRMGLKNKA